MVAGSVRRRRSPALARREHTVSERRRVVAVVDDDESVRESLPDLLEVLGFEALPFASSEAFLASDALGRADCLILDLLMHGMGGRELMRHPAVVARGVSIVVITALHDEAMRRELLRQGASECLFKPFGEESLLRALDMALGRK